MIIVDLDNCIADDAWRIPLIRWDAPHPYIRYHTYHMSLMGDPPANLHVLQGSIAIFTGRPIQYEALTRLWLDRHCVMFDHLCMRPTYDHRPSALVKLDMLTKLRSRQTITCAYDDRPDVIAMYRAQNVIAQVLAIHPIQIKERKV